MSHHELPTTNYELPLAGIRILDLTMVWAGPSGTRLLADMGAEVIKVESARSWDMLRSLHFLGGTTERWWNKAADFNHNNRNKYACTLDLQTERGRELALRLVAQSDMVFENYRADVIGKLRLDYEDLRQVKPDIILVSMPSHGKTGPEAHHVAYGTNVEQLAGLVSITGYPGLGPHKSPIAYGDPNAGAIAAAAGLAALHRRGPARRGGAVGGDGRQPWRVRARLRDGRLAGRDARQPARLARAGRVRVRHGRRVGGGLRRLRRRVRGAVRRARAAGAGAGRAVRGRRVAAAQPR
jgi:crotonobetainyl-CoA:carnitine CoA-transferase CaiB-like acyl-CoA transferase